jgi:alpha-beta hydrolase superfamily lysophospholipase
VGDLHTAGANRREALRMPAVTQSGLSSLVITYRNDIEAPRARRLLPLRGVQWKDLAAAHYAVNHGARRLLLVGYSMGGGIVMSFMHQSSLAARGALVLTANAGLQRHRRSRREQRTRVPQQFGKTVAGLRFGIHWAV